MNLLAATVVAFLLSCSMATKPQVVVMIVLKTTDNTFNCANLAPLFGRFSRANDEGKPMVNTISCPQLAEEEFHGHRHVLLQLEFDANHFQAYTFRQKKTSEKVVQIILQPFLLAGEEVEVYSVQEPATKSEYIYILQGFVISGGQRREWSDTFVENATLILNAYDMIVQHVKSSVTRNLFLRNAYGFQMAYFYPVHQNIKWVVRFKNNGLVSTSAVKNLLQPNPSDYNTFDKNGVNVNVTTGNWQRPVLKPQVVVIVVLGTLDQSLTCKDTTTLYRRFSGTELHSQGKPVVNQVTCPKDATEIMGGYRYVLIQLNFDADTMKSYASRQKMKIEKVVKDVLTPRLLSGENIQVISVYQPETTPAYFIELDAIVMLNGVSDKWKSDFWPDVKLFAQRYARLLQNVESNIKMGTTSISASQFQFAYFYQEWRRTRAVVWFKNTNFMSEDEIRHLVNRNPLPNYQLYAKNLVANIIEVNGNRPIIDTPEDFGHFADFWID